MLEPSRTAQAYVDHCVKATRLTVRVGSGWQLGLPEGDAPGVELPMKLGAVRQLIGLVSRGRIYSAESLRLALKRQACDRRFLVREYEGRAVAVFESVGGVWLPPGDIYNIVTTAFAEMMVNGGEPLVTAKTDCGFEVRWGRFVFRYRFDVLIDAATLLATTAADHRVIASFVTGPLQPGRANRLDALQTLRQDLIRSISLHQTQSADGYGGSARRVGNLLVVMPAVVAG